MVMAKFYWDENTLRAEAQKLLKLIDRESDPKERRHLAEYYDALNSTIYDYFIMPTVNTPLSTRIHNMYSTFISSQRYYMLLDSFIDPMEKHLKLYSETCDNQELLEKKISKVSGVYVSKEKAVSICYGFYRDLDDELFNYFKPLFNKRFSHIHFTGKAKESGTTITKGQSYYLLGLDTSYVEVVGSDNPGMALTLIHECGHVIDDSYNPESNLVEDNFYEVVSLFMELVANYREVGKFGTLYHHSNIVDRLSSIYSDANDCVNYDMLMGHYRNNGYRINKDFFRRAKEEDGFTKEEIVETLSEDTPNNIVYPISMSLALYFFSIYKRDNKLGLMTLKDFMSTTDRDSYIPLLKDDNFLDVVSKEIELLLLSSNETFKQELETGRRL